MTIGDARNKLGIIRMAINTDEDKQKYDGLVAALIASLKERFPMISPENPIDSGEELVPKETELLHQYEPKLLTHRPFVVRFGDDERLLWAEIDPNFEPLARLLGGGPLV